MMNEKHRVLVVENRSDVLKEIVRGLTDRGWRVDAAMSGDEAFDLILDSSTIDDPYRLVTLDLRVPQVKGEEHDPSFGIEVLLDQQRTYKLFQPDTPIIVFTAFSSFEDCVKCIKAGAYGYVSKGIPPSLEDRIPVDEPWDSFGELFKHCEEALAKPASSGLIKSQEWMEINRDFVFDKFNEQFMALVPSELAKSAELSGFSRDGFVVIADHDYNRVRWEILRHRLLRWNRMVVPILYVCED